jgi:hypothetical protein
MFNQQRFKENLVSRVIIGAIILIVMAIVALCTSCNNNQPKKTSDIKKEVGIIDTTGANVGSGLYVFVDTFLKNRPAISNNEITLDDAENEFSNEFNKQLNSGLLDTMTFTCLTVSKDIISEKPVASFVTGAARKDSLFSINVFGDALISDSLAKTLIEGRPYKIIGNITRPKEEFKLSHPSGLYFFQDLGRFKISVHQLQINLKNVTMVKY